MTDLARIFGIARSDMSKVTPAAMRGSDVFHYSIPNVQEYGTGVLEDGSTIDSDKIQITSPCVLISKLNPRKSTLCLAKPDSALTVASSEFIPLATGNGNDDRFLYWTLRSSSVTDYLNSLVTSATKSHQRVQPSNILGLSVLWPGPQMRQAVADYLDRETDEIDAMIGKLDELAENLEIRRMSVMQRSTQYADDGTRWSVVPTAHLFASIGSGTTPKDPRYYVESGVGVPWVTTSELRENLVTATLHDVTEEAVASVSSLRVHPRGAIVIAMYGATIGRLGVLGTNATMNQACCAFSSPRDVDPRFFYYNLWSQRDDIIREAAGGGQPNINQGLLRRWRVPHPPIDEQRRIADHLDQATSQIDAMLAKVAELKELLIERRAALITDVVTGRKVVA